MEGNENNKGQEENPKQNPQIEGNGNIQPPLNDDLQKVIHLSGMYQDWFLDYASYI